MVDIEMSTDHDLLELVAKAADELDRQLAEIVRLTAENEALKSKLARSGLERHKAVREAFSEAVAAEREACAELMERQHTWLTNVAASALIRARGTT